jgi:hypothetical protein
MFADAGVWSSPSDVANLPEVDHVVAFCGRGVSAEMSLVDAFPQKRQVI